MCVFIKLHQEDVIILNIYSPNTRASKIIKETLLQFKSNTDPNTVIVGNFSNQHSLKDVSYRQKLNRDMQKLKEPHKSNKPNRHLNPPNTTEYTSFPAAHYIDQYNWLTSDKHLALKTSNIM